jgi:hypothetical protein
MRPVRTSRAKRSTRASVSVIARRRSSVGAIAGARSQ